MLLTDDEIRDMARLAQARGMEVSLFARPNAAWDIGAMAVSSGGKTVSPRLRGQDQLVYCLEDIQRAASLGIRSVLLADEGALWVAGEMRQAGVLPKEMQFKISVMMASSNPAAIRQAVSIPLDIYMEVPDDLGGFVRLYEIPEVVRVAAPVYLKFGLRNAPNIYPVGKHIESVSLALSRERVRRAKIGLDLLARYYPDASQSQPGAPGLAIPVLEQADAHPNSPALSGNLQEEAGEV